MTTKRLLNSDPKYWRNIGGKCHRVHSSGEGWSSAEGFICELKDAQLLSGAEAVLRDVVMQDEYIFTSFERFKLNEGRKAYSEYITSPTRRATETLAIYKRSKE